jgi:hypothetical protein
MRSASHDGTLEPWQAVYDSHDLELVDGHGNPHHEGDTTMATCTTQYPGNMALQTEVWTLTIAEAKAALAFLTVTKDSYFEAHLLKPMRRAARAKAQTVRVYTAHFSSSALAGALFNPDDADHH